MVKYFNFIKGLREHDPPADYNLLLERIKARAGERVPAKRFVFAGALAVVLIAVGIYFSLPQNGNNSIMSYVLEQEEVNGSPLISYVFDY